MNIKITGRNFDVKPSIREYAEKKVKKLETYFHQLLDASIIMFLERQDHVMEILINGDGVQFYARERSGDMYSSIDLLCDKVEKQIVRHKERHSGHKAVGLGKMEEKEVSASSAVTLTMNRVSNKPLDPIEAFLEMRLEKRDFILFKRGIQDLQSDVDYSSRNYSIIFKDGAGYRMVEVPFEFISGNAVAGQGLIGYDIKILDESAASPRFEYVKNKDVTLPSITPAQAYEKLVADGASHLPFFNADTNFLNIIYRDGKRFSLMVPTF